MILQTKCGVRQSWAACFFLVHCGCLRLGILEPWLWWNGLSLHLEGLNLDYDLWVFAWNGLGLHLEGMRLVSFWPFMLIMCIHLCWAQVLGLEWFKKQFSISIPSRVQSQAFGLKFIHSIQGSNNYDGLKHWTWAHYSSNNGQTHAWYNAINMDRPKGRFYGSLQHG